MFDKIEKKRPAEAAELPPPPTCTRSPKSPKSHHLSDALNRLTLTNENAAPTTNSLELLKYSGQRSAFFIYKKPSRPGEQEQSKASLTT